MYPESFQHNNKFAMRGREKQNSISKGLIDGYGKRLSEVRKIDL